MGWTETESLLRKSAANGKMPHALFLHGSSDSDALNSLVTSVAFELMRLPETKRSRAQSLFMESGHPDFLYIRPAVSSSSFSRFGSIKVEQIKQIIPFLTPSTPFEAEARIIYIAFADTMTTAAQNQILKSLEEPPERTYFFLHAPKKRSVLPTILSRTVHIYMPPVIPEGYPLPSLLSAQPMQILSASLSSEDIAVLYDKIQLLADSYRPDVSVAERESLFMMTMRDLTSSVVASVEPAKDEKTHFGRNITRLLLLLFAQSIALRYNRSSLGIIDLLQNPQYISENALLFSAVTLIEKEIKTGDYIHGS